MAGLLDFLQTPQGQGLLSGVASYAMNARRGTPVNNAGRGLAGGLVGYQSALDQVNQKGDQDLARRYKTMQMQEIEDKIAKGKAEKEWRAGLPDVQAQARTQVEQFQPDDPFNQGAEAFGEVYGGQQHGQQVDPTMLNVQPGNPQALQDYLMKPESPYADKIMEAQLTPQKPMVLGRTLIDPSTGKAIAVDETWREEQDATRKQRIDELQMRLSEQRIGREESADLRRELAGQQAALRRDLAGQSAAQAARPPAGYRFTPGGNLEQIPGGPADQKAGMLGEKQEQARQLGIAQADSVLKEIGDAKKLVGGTTAGLGGVLKGIPMTGARDLEAKLTSVKANLGFDRLQAMRDASPTGGALGQVAVQELVALQATVASLDQMQSPTQLNAALDKIETHYKNWQKTLRGREGDDKVGTKPSKPKPGEIRDGYQFFGGDPSNPKSWVKVKQ